MKNIYKPRFFLSVICSLFFLQGSALAVNEDYPEVESISKMEDMGSMAGEEGLVFRPGRIRNESTKTQEIKVNRYLWQASLDTLSHTPLASVDSYGGVIITDWHSPNNKPNFRFKISVFIKDNVISPDAVEVKVFEQILKNGNWISTTNSPNLAISLENKILRRARELFISAAVKK
jgi:hypothetical protein